ncbi:hypothetical protein IE81DRAFT_73326 [Ceraceosorus guamensis]|uniref:Uncharacterized protein n=1 Tax=Ceraceosorus guamensis TaxID=1522189 RepID=A0A316W176_9BASI|nr:hypothetical protein IE81DRAFT_73326 [Ceraceosorus guamensis]PWN43657.1 hypothetical protein IE81DRAFT_73326 [Ceraceosorus guamensis]
MEPIICESFMPTFDWERAASRPETSNNCYSARSTRCTGWEPHPCCHWNFSIMKRLGKRPNTKNAAVLELAYGCRKLQALQGTHSCKRSAVSQRFSRTTPIVLDMLKEALVENSCSQTMAATQTKEAFRAREDNGAEELGRQDEKDGGAPAAHSGQQENKRMMLLKQDRLKVTVSWPCRKRARTVKRCTQTSARQHERDQYNYKRMRSDPITALRFALTLPIW